MDKFDVKELLAAINPARLTYSEWVQVGMALKADGQDAGLWDEWSRRDAARYHDGECARKWRTLSAYGGIGSGTLYHMAQEQGYRPPDDGGHALDWGDTLEDGAIIDPRWVESRDIPPAPEGDAWDPRQQIIRYLETLFEASENVGYVTESWEKDGRYLPSKGAYDRTAGELIQALSRCKEIGEVLGDYKESAGAWIRFNPLDGKGVKNENVTDYRYALVESDAMDIEKQYAIMHEMELPIAMMVYSGGKSIHAIVRIDAGSYDEYRKRVDYLYHVCEANGLKVDNQNRNPSRLSRLPGVIRNGNKQYIIESNTGKRDFTEWREWVEAANDDLPDPISLADVWYNMPQLAPPLIDGILRQGHKMLLAGPSKAGKSFALIELCIAIAEGARWMGMRCAQGQVLYVNLELDPASCDHRFREVYEAMGIAPRNYRDIDIWHLRGKAAPMDQLAPKLIRRAQKKHYIAVIIDPIYKVITGDENSAEQMAKFCCSFDTICAELGCAVIYCHHHSKGAQGGKKSMDRASGSGVFSRDPDAMLDMIQLEVTDELKKVVQDKTGLGVILDLLDARCEGGADAVLSQDEQQSLFQARGKAAQVLGLTAGEIDAAIAEAQGKAERWTAWRIESTLREFQTPKPINVWFDYPTHRIDDGLLIDAQPDGESTARGWKKKLPQRNPAKEEKAKRDAFINAVNTCNFGQPPSVQQLMEATGKSKSTILRQAKQYGYVFSTESGGYVKG